MNDMEAMEAGAFHVLCTFHALRSLFQSSKVDCLPANNPPYYNAFTAYTFSLRPHFCCRTFFSCFVCKRPEGSFCKFSKIPYAPGTKRVTENPLCHTCDCERDLSIPGANKAACMCAKLPPCYVDYSGKPVGRFQCPNKQDM